MPYSSIHRVTSEAIRGQEDYHILVRPHIRSQLRALHSPTLCPLLACTRARPALTHPLLCVHSRSPSPCAHPPFALRALALALTLARQCLQLGPTELSRFYVYWVPAQYILSIKQVIALYGGGGAGATGM